MKFKRFINPHRSSNTYVVYQNSTAVIIDVGNINSSIILNFLYENKLTLKAVFLTHEHADHCCGVDDLANQLDFTLYCSQECDKNSRSPKLNFSKYLEDIEDFRLNKEAQIVYQNSIIEIDDIQVTCYETKGHSPGCMVFKINSLLFTGDTLMQTKTPLSLPNSSKEDYEKSISKLNSLIKESTIICPGHGETFF